MLTAMAGTGTVLPQRVVAATGLPLLSQLLNGPSVMLAAAAPPEGGRVGKVGAQEPLLHVSLLVHGFPHAPQLPADVAMLMHVPEQQLHPAGQALPTAPQFEVLFSRLMHVLLLHTVPLLHCRPHAPQLRGSEVRFTQAAGQQIGSSSSSSRENVSWPMYGGCNDSLK
jgi:hypothetical protein